MPGSVPFNIYSGKATNTLPLGHHMIGGLVYPRSLFVILNDIDWLSPVATTACHENGQMIYGAMETPGGLGSCWWGDTVMVRSCVVR
jgi:hypothetical protein